MAMHSSVLSWRLPWTEEPGGLHIAWGHKKSNMTGHTHTHPCMYFSRQGMSQVAKMEMSRGIQEISI